MAKLQVTQQVLAHVVWVAVLLSTADGAHCGGVTVHVSNVVNQPLSLEISLVTVRAGEGAVILYLYHLLGWHYRLLYFFLNFALIFLTSRCMLLKTLGRDGCPTLTKNLRIF